MKLAPGSPSYWPKEHGAHFAAEPARRLHKSRLGSPDGRRPAQYRAPYYTVGHKLADDGRDSPARARALSRTPRPSWSRVLDRTSELRTLAREGELSTPATGRYDTAGSEGRRRRRRRSTRAAPAGRAGGRGDARSTYSSAPSAWVFVLLRSRPPVLGLGRMRRARARA